MYTRMASYSQRNFSTKYWKEDGVGKKRNTLKYDVLKRAFYLDVFGWRSYKKEPLESCKAIL
jgi:hypothetical protein